VPLGLSALKIIREPELNVSGLVSEALGAKVNIVLLPVVLSTITTLAELTIAGLSVSNLKVPCIDCCTAPYPEVL